MRTFAGVKVVIVAAVGTVAIACGQSHSPVTPSALAAPVTSAAAPGQASGSNGLNVGQKLLLPKDKDHEDEVDGEGRVTQLIAGTACPTLQFVAEGVLVRATAATIFEDGSCGNILPGVKIEAKGARQADGSIVASRIEIRERVEDEVDGDGRVTSLVAGTFCPALQFIVEGAVVRTTAATIFENATCSDIQPGMKVEAKATRQPDGSFVASRIKIEDEGIEGEGRVTSLVGGTACPALQFVVEGITVKTSASTIFDGGTCASVQPGTRVHVRGARVAFDTVIASRVRTQD